MRYARESAALDPFRIPPIHFQRMKRSLTALIALSLLCLTLGLPVYLLLPKLMFMQREQVAEQLVEDLANEKGREASAVLEEVAQLGNASIHALVNAAGAARADTAMAARELLIEKLTIWQNRAALDESFDLQEPLTLLAGSLARQVNDLGPLGRQWAKGLILTIADLSANLPPDAAAELLADCTRVLDAVPATGFKKRTPNRLLDIRLGERPLPSAEPNVDALSLSSESVIAPPSPSFSPLEPLPPKATAPAVRPGERSTSDDAIGSPRAGSNWIPNWTQRLQDEPRGQQAVPPLAEEQPDDSAPLESAAEAGPPPRFVDVPSPAEMESRLSELRNQSTRRLFQLLRTAVSFERSMVAAVLEERGFKPAEFELGIRLVSSDSLDRLALIHDLAILPSSVARRWLRELLHDTDAEVRFQALTAMGTTSDPTLVHWARTIAAEDADPRVAALAARIASESR